MVSQRHCYLCASSDQAFQVAGFQADAEQNTTNQQQSQVEREENQEVHPEATKEQKECDYTEGFIPWLIFSDINSRHGSPNKIHQPLKHTLPLQLDNPGDLGALSPPKFLIQTTAVCFGAPPICKFQSKVGKNRQNACTFPPPSNKPFFCFLKYKHSHR